MRRQDGIGAIWKLVQSRRGRPIIENWATLHRADVHWPGGLRSLLLAALAWKGQILWRVRFGGSHGDVGLERYSGSLRCDLNEEGLWAAPDRVHDKGPRDKRIDAGSPLGIGRQEGGRGERHNRARRWSSWLLRIGHSLLGFRNVW